MEHEPGRNSLSTTTLKKLQKPTEVHRLSAKPVKFDMALKGKYHWWKYAKKRKISLKGRKVMRLERCQYFRQKLVRSLISLLSSVLLNLLFPAKTELCLLAVADGGVLCRLNWWFGITRER